MSRIGVVLPAGGSGKRFGGDRPKQLGEIGGVPIWIHALNAFAFRTDLAAVAVVVPADRLDDFRATLAEISSGTFGSAAPVPRPAGAPELIAVAGGAERWLSVRNGIAALPSGVDRVMVHDVARPFVSAAIVNACVDRLNRGEGAIVARPCADTVKRVDEEGVAVETLDRQNLRLAQTPQCFLRSDLEEWYRRAERESGFLPTDEASLAERYGARVGIVPGDGYNDKITLPEDFARFRALWETGELESLIEARRF